MGKEKINFARFQDQKISLQFPRTEPVSRRNNKSKTCSLLVLLFYFTFYCNCSEQAFDKYYDSSTYATIFQDSKGRFDCGCVLFYDTAYAWKYYNSTETYHIYGRYTQADLLEYQSTLPDESWCNCKKECHIYVPCH